MLGVAPIVSSDERIGYKVDPLVGRKLGAVCGRINTGTIEARLEGEPL